MSKQPRKPSPAPAEIPSVAVPCQWCGMPATTLEPIHPDCSSQIAAGTAHLPTLPAAGEEPAG